MESSAAFLQYSTDKLKQSASRIDVCLDKLSEEQVWMRGSDSQNSIANLVLHLCGNVRQWILSGVANQPDNRQRDSEFAARDGASVADLKAMLAQTVEEATRAIANVAPSDLARRTEVQRYDVSVLEAIYHVVEHFSYHTGLIIFATKWATGEDLGFYRHLQRLDHVEKTP